MSRDLDNEIFSPKTKEYELLRNETLSETIERMNDRDRRVKQKGTIHLDSYKNEKKARKFLQELFDLQEQD